MEEKVSSHPKRDAYVRDVLRRGADCDNLFQIVANDVHMGWGQRKRELASDLARLLDLGDSIGLDFVARPLGDRTDKFEFLVVAREDFVHDLALLLLTAPFPMTRYPSSGGGDAV